MDHEMVGKEYSSFRIFRCKTNKQTNKDKSGKIWMFVLWLYEPSHMQSKTENKTLSTNENIITKFPNKNLVVGRKVCLES